MNHRTFFGSKRWLLLFVVSLVFISINIFLTPKTCYADDDSSADRNRHANKRADRFYKRPTTVNHFAALSAEYDSDEDSKQQIIKLDHYFKNNKFISDIEISLETLYEEQRSSNRADKNYYSIKERDLFKLISSQKFILFSSNWYGVFFNETRHDNESDISYQDIVTSAGIGKIFLNGGLELDVSAGMATGRNITDTTHESQRRNYKRSVVVPSFRIDVKLMKNIRFVSRGYSYFSDAIMSYYLNSRLQYRMSKNVYWQVSHLFDKREFNLYDKKTNIYDNYGIGFFKIYY